MKEEPGPEEPFVRVSSRRFSERVLKSTLLVLMLIYIAFLKLLLLCVAIVFLVSLFVCCRRRRCWLRRWSRQWYC